MLYKSAEQLSRAAFDLNLISQRQLQEIWGRLGTHNVPVDEFAKLLTSQDVLTSYQLARLKRGEKDGFFYGDCKVLYFIGSGSFARVFRAVNEKTGEIVALKVLRKKFVEGKDQESKEAREQFLREGQVGITLRHPNIVPIFEVETDKDGHYLVMEFIEGRNLREFVNNREKCGPDEALRLIADVATGLDYALDRGIAHRDIKLSNVLVSSRGTAKLVDFGLAAPSRDSDDAISDHPNPRTIDYAALERATNVRKDDKRSDIYFVGCMLYHLLCGESPLPEVKDRIKRLSKTRFHEVVPIRNRMPTLPRPIASIVTKAMQLDPQHRFQSPKELLVEIERVISKLSEFTSLDQTAADDTVVEDEAARKARKQPQRAVMFVESNPQMQDVFRKHLKSGGFRVLISGDPTRAAGRFEEDFPPAHCIVFCTEALGEVAFEAFQRFLDNPATEDTPAVLLLAEHHAEWAKQVVTKDHQVVVQLPTKLSGLREVLDRLVPHASLSSEEL
ncbi:MAG: serine/threonine-protein kinase [Planctomycetota bacterium]|nr:serine/threonine-protein kinase [Planctomycetota bacterium]